MKNKEIQKIIKEFEKEFHCFDDNVYFYEPRKPNGKKYVKKSVLEFLKRSLSSCGKSGYEEGLKDGEDGIELAVQSEQDRIIGILARLKEETRKETGSFKYDFVYEEAIKEITKE